MSADAATRVRSQRLSRCRYWHVAAQDFHFAAAGQFVGHNASTPHRRNEQRFAAPRVHAFAAAFEHGRAARKRKGVERSASSLKVIGVLVRHRSRMK
jgi:hypothetical protein